jgi:hypothetical protein
VSKNARGFVAAVVLGLVAAAVVVSSFVTARGVGATLGLISGVGLVLLGQVLRRPSASPNRRNSAIAAAVGILALPVVGLVLGSGVKNDVATFVAGFLLPNVRVSHRRGTCHGGQGSGVLASVIAKPPTPYLPIGARHNRSRSGNLCAVATP